MWIVRRQAKYPAYFAGEVFAIIGESKQGRMADALAHGGDEGRDKLR